VVILNPVDKNDLHMGHQYFYLKVSGDSMNMKIQDGDLVLIQCQDTLEDGEIGAIMVNGDDATIKRYKRKGDIIILEPMSYNPTHQVQMYDISEVPVKIIGKAVGGKIIF
jgi:repressor LexA